MNRNSFKFRLEAVRKLRKQREDVSRRFVAATLREISAASARLEGSQARLAEAVEQTRHDAGAHVPGAGHNLLIRLRRHRLYRDHLRGEIAQQEQSVAALDRRLAQERAALIDASRQFKVIEKLRERRRAEYDEAVRRRETAVQDELAVSRHVRAAAARLES